MEWASSIRISSRFALRERGCDSCAESGLPQPGDMAAFVK